MLLLVIYVCIFYPYHIGFNRKFSEGLLFYLQVLTAISLIFNILMTSVTAVKTKKRDITNFRGILNYRLNTLGFYLDLVSMIPFEYIVTIHTSVNYHDEYRNHLFYMCKGLKLCLVWRLSSFFENLEKKLLLNSLLIKVKIVEIYLLIFFLLWNNSNYLMFLQICKYSVYICLLCYWCGVVLFMESCFVSRCSENSWFSRALLWDDQISGVSVNQKK